MLTLSTVLRRERSGGKKEITAMHGIKPTLFGCFKYIHGRNTEVVANAIRTMKRKKFNATKKRLFETALRVIEKMDGVITYENLTKGLIEAELPGGLMSYGNDIKISIKPTSDNKNNVSIISRSTGIQIVDWGTNSTNEEKIINRINSALA